MPPSSIEEGNASSSGVRACNVPIIGREVLCGRVQGGGIYKSYFNKRDLKSSLVETPEWSRNILQGKVQIPSHCHSADFFSLLGLVPPPISSYC